MLDFSVVDQSWGLLLQGAKITAYITLWGLLGGILLGGLTGIIRASSPVKFDRVYFRQEPVFAVIMPILSFISQAYIWLIRGTPIVVQVMFIYFALPQLLGITFDALTAAIITIVINAGAYVAEVVRGAFLSVSNGLYEAGSAMGLNRWQIFTRILGPVAFRRMIPSLGNQCIISLKDTSIFIVIGVAELTRTGQEIIAQTYRSIEIWSVVALMYLAMTSVIALVLKLIENRMRIL